MHEHRTYYGAKTGNLSRMTYGHVPHLDRQVSRLVLGSMAFSFEELDRTFASLDAYVEAGGNAIDTGRVYGPSHHRAIGAFLDARGRETLIVTDKVGHPDRYGSRITRDKIREDLDINQGDLSIGMTEVMVLHRDDESVPVGEIVDWLDELVQERRIGGYGLSNWSRTRVAEAAAYASENARQGPSLASPQVCLAVPNEPMWANCVTLDEADILGYAKMALPVFSWSSGGSGFFAGRESDDLTRVYVNPGNLARRERARELAERLGTNPSAIAVAWVLGQPGQVHAIIGPRNADEVRENLDVRNLQLSAEDLRYLREG